MPLQYRFVLDQSTDVWGLGIISIDQEYSSYEDVKFDFDATNQKLSLVWNSKQDKLSIRLHKFLTADKQR
jgi:hypothetical protein